MHNCTACPRECGIDRDAHRGYCGQSSAFRIARAALHMWEEPCISGTRGSGTVFFSGCNLGCVFCQNYRVSHRGQGIEISADTLAQKMLELQEQGAHNINLVTPTQYAEQLARELERVKPKLQIPVVYNCGGYESVEALRRMDGLVEIYLPDFKYVDPSLAERYSGAADYCEVATAALREMLRQTGKPILDADGMMKRGTIVRHLVLPGCRQNSVAVLRHLADTFGTEDFLLSLMSQYTPEFAKDSPDSNLHRRVTSFEYDFVLSEVDRLGFSGNFQARASADSSYTPDFYEASFLPQ